jgi:3-hydroxybutyryl-CoA dehydrogenase
MENREHLNIGIIGEGKMGTNLFYYLLDFGFSITWVCHKEAEKEKMIKSFNKKLKRSLDAGILDETAYSNINLNTKITSDLKQLKYCDLIIEAIPENIDLKKKLFVELERIAPVDCIFASNSSSINPSEIFPSESRKNRFIGLHFFYPVALKNIVEFIVSDSTSNEVIQKINQFLSIIQRDHLLLQESDSFILNKIFLDFQNEAFIIVNEGNMTISQIDMLVKKYFFPIGVFDFCDNVGNDIMLTSVSNYVKNYSNKDHYTPFVQELHRLVKEGRLGIKSQSGFYSYPIEAQPDDSSLNDFKIKILKRLQVIIASTINRFSSQSGISAAILNNAMKEYLGSEKDLLSFQE